MYHSYKYYLKCDINVLKSMDAKLDLITSERRFDFTDFCREASREQIEALLSGSGLLMLLNMPDAKDRINGGVINGVTDNSLLKDRDLCEFLHNNGAYFENLLNQNADDYITFLQEEHPLAIPGVFSDLRDDVQKHILENHSFSRKEINSMLYKCKPQTLQFLLDTDDRISLDDISCSRLEVLGDKNVSIPERLFSRDLVLNVSTMDDVNRYRFLIDSLSFNCDTSKIEKARKQFYEGELEFIEEDGLLPEYRDLLESLKRGEDISIAPECLGRFGFNQDITKALGDSEDIETTIKMLSDYKMSNMIIDYFFEAIPTNILIDMQEMLNFQTQLRTLSASEIAIFSSFAKIDTFDVEEKLELYKAFKGQNLMELFYDCYSRTKELMVDSINETVLSSQNIGTFLSSEKTTEYGVPVYHMHGQPYKALIRGWGKDKALPLDKKDVEFNTDGSSFSIDGSDLLKPFQEPTKLYNIAYSGIPKNQLIHLFPVDSYTNYKRGPESGVPDRNTYATSRKMKFLAHEGLTQNTSHYNEALIAVPNSLRVDSEFDAQLQKPEPLAIYCYDKITPNDVDAAKKLGVGIILVETMYYERASGDRLSAADTIINPDDYNYAQSGQEDSRFKKISKKSDRDEI